ncbi:MAG: divergent polysaccharide deacetylase family protein [Geobacteraceae bacterium]|nr:divergent polysaccharide deacetylase family protein [Geobacteraceae bacterium]
MAVIVDDMGSSMGELKELVSINIPLTFAVIPGLAKSKAVAEAAHTAGRQVMVHLPMEPQGYPKQKLEANGLLISQSEDEIVSRTVDLINGVPHAIGANNHMGSRFTEHEEKMIPVLNVLRDKGLFFIDSRTSPKSKGLAVAERLGVKSGTRNVFLDNEQDVAAIKRQLVAAAEMAKRKGGVIAICHPHAATIAALKEAMPELQAGGITFVPAAELVR